ncbi:DUF2189 domain-containing protein [Parvularcula marina]|uniref:DUF2189 domain-containing protein n=1 Tax=Parvularcula marina TaxID=2292771 RepID=A0A371R7M9_9PROT|nr:DUF2189 domain-containing protein [Parvularcula marina]
MRTFAEKTAIKIRDKNIEEEQVTPNTAESISSSGNSIPMAKKLSATAPWRWLEKGWADYQKRPLLAAGYGVLFVALGYAIVLGLSLMGMTAAVPVAVGAFALVGPLMAAGLYAYAREIEAGRLPGWRDVLFVKAAAPIGVAYLGVMLLFGLFIWTLCALGLLVMFAGGQYIAPGEFTSFALGTLPGLSLLTIGTIVGGIIAFSIFAITAFSIPMLMDKDVDFATAIGASVNAVIAQPKPMLLWAWIIAASVAISAATFLLGFILLFPLIGLATWHGYREAFGD